MDFGPNRYDRQSEATRPPNVFFDGTRLGLEGTMLTTLIVAGLGGMHIGLSSSLGYAVRMVEGLPEQAKPFALFGFLGISVLSFVSLAMLLFFSTSIPTMLYSMGLVYLMLRWAGKRWGREKLASTIIGAVLGLIAGILVMALVALIFGASLTGSSYATLYRWPAILSIDGIALFWLTLYPLISTGVGAQIGWRLGKQIENMMLYWFW